MKPDPTRGIAGRSTKPGDKPEHGPLGPESQNLAPWMLALVVIGPSVFLLIQNLLGFWLGIAASSVVIVVVAGALILTRRKKRHGEGH